MLTAVRWLQNMKASISETKEIEIDKLQRYMLLKVVARSSFFGKIEIKRLQDRERTFDFGDVDDIESYGVRASISDDESKEALFDSYIACPSTLNPKQMEASAKHFYDFSNRAQCEQYAERFLASVEQVFRDHHRDYAL